MNALYKFLFSTYTYDQAKEKLMLIVLLMDIKY